MVDRHGNWQSISWTVWGNPDRRGGAIALFTWSNGVITHITQPDQTSWTYAYDSKAT